MKNKINPLLVHGNLLSDLPVLKFNLDPQAREARAEDF